MYMHSQLRWTCWTLRGTTCTNTHISGTDHALCHISEKENCCGSSRHHFSSSKWTISPPLPPPSRFGFRTVELVKRNISARILLPLPWWHRLLLVSWHHLWWRICNTQPIFPQMHRSLLHWLIWMVTNMNAHHYAFYNTENTLHLHCLYTINLVLTRYIIYRKRFV